MADATEVTDATALALLDQLAATPEDWQLRRALADRFLDIGDETAAECLRWTAENHKRAYDPGRG